MKMMARRSNLAAAMRYAGNSLGLRLWSNEEGLVALLTMAVCPSVIQILVGAGGLLLCLTAFLHHTKP
jgi:hypothetical protein